MSNKLLPEVSAWYQDVASGNLFEIVAVDEASGTIEYQLIDGEIGEFDEASWNQLYLIAAEAPEDWRAPFELSDGDDSHQDFAQVPENLSGVLSGVEPELMDLGDNFKIYHDR